MLRFAFILCLCATSASAALLRSTISQWIWQTSVLAGDWLFIDAGEFYEYINGTLKMYYQSGTIGVSLQSSWTNASVYAINTNAPAGMSLTRRPTLWYDASTNKVYKWGGWPYLDNQTCDLWSFEPNSTGKAGWAREPSPSENGLDSDCRAPFGAAFTASNTTYYSLSGAVGGASTAIQGLAQFDFSGQTWSNHTAATSEQSGFYVQSGTAFAPNFGKSGFLVVAGGDNPATQDYKYEQGSALVDMSIISLYDVDGKKWYRQTATGDVPPPRSEFCLVGAPSVNGDSFEIFVYGGSTNQTTDWNNADDDGYLDVYVMSIPGFQWFQAPARSSLRRANHYCQIIGNRQMLVIGGRFPSDLQNLGVDYDPWTSGINIFDMSAFVWQDLFNATAAPYEQAGTIKQYYASSYQEPSWGDPALASIFAFTSQGSNNTNTTAPPHASASATPQSKSGTSHTGAIVGGVVGGVGGLALIAAIAFFVLHRKKKSRAASEQASPPYRAPVEAPLTEKPRHELEHRGPQPTELPGTLPNMQTSQVKRKPLSPRPSEPAELAGN